MNYGFDIHVANKTIKHRFQKKRDCINKFIVILGIESLFIQTYDRISINVSTPTKKKLMKFLNVSYVSNFIINIVAKNIFADKKLHFDTAYDYLYKNNTLVVLVSKIEAHYVFKNNKNFEKMSIFAVIVRENFILKWYQLFVYINNDVVQHLQQIAEEIKLTNNNKMPLINKCEKYALFKTYKIVSKLFEKSKISNKWFYRIIYDFIDITTALNKHK